MVMEGSGSNSCGSIVKKFAVVAKGGSSDRSQRRSLSRTSSGAHSASVTIALPADRTIPGNERVRQATAGGNIYVFDFWVGQPKTEPDGTTPVTGFPTVQVQLLTNGVTDNLGGNGTATLTPLTGSGSVQNVGCGGSCAVVFNLPSPGSGQWQLWELRYNDQFVNSGFVGIGLADLNATNNTAVNFDIAAPGVPEPATWGMMLLGFVGLGFAFRQSRRKVAFA